jgi:hypothetical protein
VCMLPGTRPLSSYRWQRQQQAIFSPVLHLHLEKCSSCKLSRHKANPIHFSCERCNASLFVATCEDTFLNDHFQIWRTSQAPQHCRLSEATSPRPQVSSNLLDITLDVPDLGLSVVDHVPQELLYAHMSGLQLGYTTGLGRGVTRARLVLRHFQVRAIAYNSLALRKFNNRAAVRTPSRGKYPFKLSMQFNGFEVERSTIPEQSRLLFWKWRDEAALLIRRVEGCLDERHLRVCLQASNLVS